MTDPMTDTIAAENAMRADRAERILELLRHRDPAEADVQASAMVMAGLTMLQETRGTPAVLAVLEKMGPAFCDDGKAASPTEGIPLRDRAGHMIDDLMNRDLDAASFEARAMLAAGTTILQDRFSTEAALDVLNRLTVAAREREVLLMGPAPLLVTGTPEPKPSEDLASTALGFLRAMPPDLGQAQACAAIAASAAYLRETAGDTAALDTLAGVTDAVRYAGPSATLSATVSSAPTSDQIALSLLDLLRGMTPDQAHEHARAAIVGAEAFLVEAHGPDYTSAVVSGLLENATRHIEVWGASHRPADAALH